VLVLLQPPLLVVLVLVLVVLLVVLLALRCVRTGANIPFCLLRPPMKKKRSLFLDDNSAALHAECVF
jgi:hypothetical protein